MYKNKPCYRRFDKVVAFNEKHEVVYGEIFTSMYAGEEIGHVYTLLDAPGMFIEAAIIPEEYANKPFIEVMPLFLKRSTKDGTVIEPTNRIKVENNVYRIGGAAND